MVSCNAFYGVYITYSICHIVVSIKNDGGGGGGAHRKCSLTGVIRVPSAFLRKL